jgi:hypothetical protein
MLTAAPKPMFDGLQTSVISGAYVATRLALPSWDALSTTMI